MCGINSCSVRFNPGQNCDMNGIENWVERKGGFEVLEKRKIYFFILGIKPQIIQHVV